jgi:hypothetical protein
MWQLRNSAFSCRTGIPFLFGSALSFEAAPPVEKDPDLQLSSLPIVFHNLILVVLLNNIDDYGCLHKRSGNNF